MDPRTSVALAVLSAGIVSLCGGCAATHPTPIAPATEREKGMFDAIKKLDGEWTMVDEKGATQTASVYKVTSAGNVVREIMFPGSPHEMTNAYHLDGQSLVLTHYCAVGNQPRMRAVGNSPHEIDFKFDNVTNLTGKEDTYMGAMRLVIKDDDHIEQHWKAFKNGEVLTDHCPVFELTRKK